MPEVYMANYYNPYDIVPSSETEITSSDIDAVLRQAKKDKICSDEFLDNLIEANRKNAALIVCMSDLEAFELLKMMLQNIPE